MRVRNPLTVMQIRAEPSPTRHLFGMVRTNNQGLPDPHQGVDLLAPVGTPVYAVADAVVEWVRPPVGNYGRQILLRFSTRTTNPPPLSAPDGFHYYAFYAHLSNVSVAAGQTVRAGELIGFTGRTGYETETGIPSHLHFEIRTTPEIPPAGSALRGRVDPFVFLDPSILSCRSSAGPGQPTPTATASPAASPTPSPSPSPTPAPGPAQTLG